ncbi:hypothetical protein FOCC_FOCC003338 [Frankliniella occidentalis]|nr:hypothetical protein FOCC_FOCC003338 [Frankliniella occidentalis]
MCAVPNHAASSHRHLPERGPDRRPALPPPWRPGRQLAVAGQPPPCGRTFVLDLPYLRRLSLFFSLPRHHFAEVQKVLFPLYFGINAALSLLTLGTFVRMQHGSQHQWDAEVIVQVGSMVLCFLLELLVRLYLTPPLLRLITAKTDMEKTVAGVGQEVGRYDLGPLTQCPHYVKIHRAFRKVHAGIALANIAAMGCTALHAHYLAGKICI